MKVTKRGSGTPGRYGRIGREGYGRIRYRLMREVNADLLRCCDEWTCVEETTTLVRDFCI